MSVKFKYNKNTLGYEYVLRAPQGITGRAMQGRANKIRNAARLQAGFRTGALKVSIEASRVKSGVNISYEIGSGLSYAMMHHEGTKPHLIHGRNGGMLRFTSQSRVVYSREVMHPGTRPNRFLTDNIWLALK